MTFTVNADPSGREFHINVNAKGKDTQNTVDRHQHLALLPDLDSAGYMLLTQIAMENPPVSWVLIPKETGLLVPSVYKRDANVRGRLDGREIDVQHTTVTISAQNAVNVELFHTFGRTAAGSRSAGAEFLCGAERVQADRSSEVRAAAQPGCEFSTAEWRAAIFGSAGRSSADAAAVEGCSRLKLGTWAFLLLLWESRFVPRCALVQ